MPLSPTTWAEFELPLSVDLDNLSSHARGLMESLRLLPGDYAHTYIGRLVERPSIVTLVVGKAYISGAAPVAGWLT